MSKRIERREFITLLGGAAAVWPVAAHAQQRTRPVVGILFVGWPELTASLTAAVRQGLSEAGYVDGRNITIEYRYARGDAERLPRLAAELVALPVDVFIASTRADIVAKSATSSIPIIFMSGVDPVRAGLVTSLSRPQDNATGVTILTHDLETKRIGLVRELIPHAQSMGVIEESGHPESAFRTEQLLLAARSVNMPIHVASTATSERALEAAFASLASLHVSALLVGASVYFANYRDLLVDLAARHRIPAMYELRSFVEAGGLVSYSASLTDAFRQVGAYAGKILSGAKPADLPVQQPTKFELVINLKAAKGLGLEVPPTLLARADEVIE